jgi:hypothetical protein
MSDETTRIMNAFFESYRKSFEESDAAAIADHFAYPSHITSDAGDIVLTPIPGRQEWIAQLEQLLGAYRTIGVASARILDLQATELSPRLVQANVHWTLHDRAGRDLYDFDALYTLARIDGNLRIAAISHNETSRLRACLAKAKTQDGNRGTGKPRKKS